MNKALSYLAKLAVAIGSLAILAFSISAVNRAHVVIPAQAVATSDMLTLATIARIDGDNVSLIEKLRRISLGYAPSVGSSRMLLRAEVTSAIESAGIELTTIDLSMPARVNIDRASQTITSEQITRAVEKYVRERYQWSGGEVVLRVITPAEDVIAPQGALTIEPNLPNTSNPSDQFFVSVAIQVDGRAVKYLNVELNAEAVAVIAVMAHAVQRGDAVTINDVRFERRSVGADLRQYLTSERELLGKAASVGLAEGAVLTMNMLNDRMLVKRGDAVKLVAQAGKLEIFTTGEAKGGGRLGDRIEVVNRSSGQVVVGEIVGDKTVRVSF